MLNPYQPPDGGRDPSQDEKSQAKKLPEAPSLVLTAPLSIKMKALLVYAGILVPLGSFVIARGGMPDGPTWQTGKLGDKLSFVLSAHGGFILYPFMLIVMSCLVYYIAVDRERPTRFANRAVFFGGVLLSGFYCVTLWIVVCRTVGAWLLLVSCQLGFPLLVFGLPWIARRMPFKIPAVLKFGFLGLLLAGYVVALVTDPKDVIQGTFGIAIGFPFAASLFCGPAWAMLAYGFVFLRIACDRRASPPRTQVDILAAMAYLIGAVNAILLSIRFAWTHYSTLPTQPPRGDCYVVTAASKGHPAFVGAWVETRDGQPVRVNRQLQRLRDLEKRLACNWPRHHAILRHVYNRIGPPMASMLRNQWLADLAYVSLKPIEWCAVVILKCRP